MGGASRGLDGGRSPSDWHSEGARVGGLEICAEGDDKGVEDPEVGAIRGNSGGRFAKALDWVKSLGKSSPSPHAGKISGKTAVSGEIDGSFGDGNGDPFDALCNH